MTTPAGIFSLPLSYLRATIAGSSSFQTLVGALNAAAALSSIYYVSAPGGTSPPYAVVDWGRSARWTSGRDGVRNWFDSEGELLVLLRAAVSDGTDSAQGDDALAFMNTAGAIASELLELTGQPGYLDVTTLEHGQPERPTEDLARQVGDFHQILFTVRWRA